MEAEFERTRGVRVEGDYAGSNLLLSRIKLSGQGDLYLPGDAWYVRQAEAEGLIASSVDACYLVPVLLVAQGNPQRIRGVADLARPGLRVGLGETRACAIGQVTEEILKKNGLDPAKVEPNVAFRALTVNELGVQIKAGKLDAAIVWDAVAQAYLDAGQIIAIPPERNVISTVPVAVLRSSKHPDLARAFQEFATSRRGREIWARHGYSTEPPE
jgi:molybdate transport system substrate-binding protein